MRCESALLTVPHLILVGTSVVVVVVVVVIVVVVIVVVVVDCAPPCDLPIPHTRTQ